VLRPVDARWSASYVLPIRRAAGVADDSLDELVAYLQWLSVRLDVVVVDGSDRPLSPDHPLRRCALRYLQPEHSTPNGKVAGVLTGMRYAAHERVVIADDDVRYDEGSLREVLRRLDDADLVKPQNVFRPLPWHARWDSARSLLNRALTGDFPGTFAVRRSAFFQRRGYCGAVLFENLQLVRTMDARRIVRADDVFVVRRPPTSAHFLGQRVRQAFDSRAQPLRWAVELSLLPGAVVAAVRGGPPAIGAAALGAVLVAERGRRRAGAREVFPADVAWWAPLWLAERAVCSWVAVVQRARHGGVAYAGSRLAVAASSRRAIADNRCPVAPCACAEARAALTTPGRPRGADEHLADAPGGVRRTDPRLS
jgi:hypothetical protein